MAEITNSHLIIKVIMSHLFQAEHRRLQKWTDIICNKQMLARGDNQSLGFLYAGEYHRPEWLPIGKFPKMGLHHSLWPEMDKFLADRKIIRDDEQLISQTLFAMVRGCSDQQELRDALPECLVSIIPEFTNMKRYCDAKVRIMSNERAHRQYLKVLPLIEAYAVARLIY
jgi:hypothetical protein